MAVRFSAETHKQFEDVLTRYPTKQAAILPTLWLAQTEFGYLSPAVMEHVADLLDLSPAYVRGVATFYTMFYTEPMGRCHVQVCTNLSCTLRGAEHIVRCLEDRLGVKVGQTTSDNMFSLSEVECLGSCGTAPVVQVGDDYHENQTPERMLSLIDALAKQPASAATPGPGTSDTL